MTIGAATAGVIDARLTLDDGTDPASAGAVVTTELCGHWEHEGPCRWPHNTAIDTDVEPARLRTVFVAEPDEAAQVEARIEAALRSNAGWRLVAITCRAPGAVDRPLADRLLAGPRRARPAP
jgi:hypothetical protein